jgi:hypothetical protein
LVGSLEGVAAVIGQVVVDPTPVVGVGPALYQAAGDEAVHESGDGGSAHGEAAGQVGGGGFTFVQEGQDPVLGETQVNFAERDGDLAGQLGCRPGRCHHLRVGVGRRVLSGGLGHDG